MSEDTRDGMKDFLADSAVDEMVEAMIVYLEQASYTFRHGGDHMTLDGEWNIRELLAAAFENVVVHTKGCPSVAGNETKIKRMTITPDFSLNVTCSCGEIVMGVDVGCGREHVSPQNLGDQSE
jgi:hypothetical protein